MAGSVLALFAVIVFILTERRGGQENVTYKETQAEYGLLTIGVTKSGSIDIGTVEQSFDLDMSALQRVVTGNSENSMGAGDGGSAGGMEGLGAFGSGPDLFGQMFGGGGSLTETGEASHLTVAGVGVSVGQQVTKGDVLYELAEESVSVLENKRVGKYL